MYDHNAAANDFFQHLMRDPSFFDPIESGGEELDDRGPVHATDPSYNRFLRRHRSNKHAAAVPDPDGA